MQQQSLIPLLFYYWFHPTSGLTGGPRVLLNLLERLDRSKFYPIVITQQESPLTEELHIRGIETVLAPLPKIINSHNDAVFSYSLMDKLSSLIAILKYNFDIVAIAQKYHVRGLWGRNVKAITLIGGAATFLHLPLVWDIGMEKESRGLVKILHWAGLMMSAVVITEARCQPLNIFGNFTAKLFAAKFRTICPGISSERIDKIRKAKVQQVLDPKHFIILSVATIHPRKNQMMLLRSMKSLVPRFPQIHVYFVGATSDEAYSSQLEYFAQTENLTENVHFLGWQDNIPELMSKANLFVLCSYNEGIPYVIHEALHSGLPVVATAVGGVPEIIEHGKTGFLIDVDDDRSLCDLIERFICYPDSTQTTSETAMQLVQSQYSIQSWSEHYNHLFETLTR